MIFSDSDYTRLSEEIIGEKQYKNFAFKFFKMNKNSLNNEFLF